MAFLYASVAWEFEIYNLLLTIGPLRQNTAKLWVNSVGAEVESAPPFNIAAFLGGKAAAHARRDPASGDQILDDANKGRTFHFW